MKPNFLIQFGGPKPEPALWCVEVSTLEPHILMLYAAPDWSDAIKLVAKLRLKHPTAQIRVVGDLLVQT